MLIAFAVMLLSSAMLGYAAVTFQGFSGYLNYVGVTIIATIGFVFANSKLPPMVYVVGVNSAISVAALVIICVRMNSLPSVNSIIGIGFMVLGIYFTMR
jgi:hypothetical protein